MQAVQLYHMKFATRMVRHLGKLGHSNHKRRQGQAARLVKAPLHKRVEYGYAKLCQSRAAGRRQQSRAAGVLWP